MMETELIHFLCACWGSLQAIISTCMEHFPLKTLKWVMSQVVPELDSRPQRTAVLWLHANPFGPKHPIACPAQHTEQLPVLLAECPHPLWSHKPPIQRMPNSKCTHKSPTFLCHLFHVTSQSKHTPPMQIVTPQLFC